MWPFVSWSEIDWAVTAQMLTAIGAISALVWGVKSSQLAEKSAALSKIAAYRVSWIEGLRDSSATLSALLASMVDENNPDGRSDMIQAMRISDEIKMKLRGEEYQQIQNTIREMINSHLNVVLGKEAGLQALEKCSQHSFAFTEQIAEICSIEWQRAKKELRGQAA